MEWIQKQPKYVETKAFDDRRPTTDLSLWKNSNVHICADCAAIYGGIGKEYNAQGV